MMKKILIVILAFLLVLSFDACKSRQADSDKDIVTDSKTPQSEINLPDATVSGDEDSNLAEKPENQEETGNQDGQTDKDAQENQTGDNIVADAWENPSDNISDAKVEIPSSSNDSEQKTENEEVLNTNPTYEGDEGWLPWR